MNKLPLSVHRLHLPEAVETRKVLEIKGFCASYVSFLDINTTVSTWLDCSRWMSKPRKISPFVLGNKSTAFLTSKLPFSRPRTFSETGRCACPYLYNTAAHIFQSPRHFALREYVRKSVVYHPLDSTAGSCTDTNPCLGIHTGKEAHILLFADSHASQKSYDSSWPRMEYQKQR